MRAMYVFAKWKRSRNGAQPSVPRGWSFLVLGDCRGSEWVLLTVDKDASKKTKRLVPVPARLRTLLESATRYPPALALARADLGRVGNPRWGPEAIGAEFARLLERHLRAQPRAQAFLIEAQSTEPGYLDKGEFVWALEQVIDPSTKRPLIRWVSCDFFIYTNPASDFRLTPELRRRFERTDFERAVEEGLADADAGRGLPHAEVVDRMKARFPRGKSSR